MCTMDVWMEEWVESQSRRLKDAEAAKAAKAAEQLSIGRRARLARRLGIRSDA